jgi:hypothetical protein
MLLLLLLLLLLLMMLMMMMMDTGRNRKPIKGILFSLISYPDPVSLLSLYILRKSPPAAIPWSTSQ